MRAMRTASFIITFSHLHMVQETHLFATLPSATAVVRGIVQVAATAMRVPCCKAAVQQYGTQQPASCRYTPAMLGAGKHVEFFLDMPNRVRVQRVPSLQPFVSLHCTLLLGIVGTPDGVAPKPSSIGLVRSPATDFHADTTILMMLLSQ